MIDIKLLRDNPGLVKASQRARGEDEKLVDAAIAADNERRAAISEFESARAQQNVLSKSVGAAKGDETAKLLERSKELAATVKATDAKRAELDERAQKIFMGLANLVDPNAPVGGEADFVVLEEIGTPTKFDFEPKDHVELGKILGAIDTERGAKVSGSRFYYLTGNGALLEFALINFAIANAVKNGFIPVIPPVLVKPPAMEGTGFLGQAAENVFHLEEDDFYLVGTSEVPLAAYHMDEILDSEKFPLRYAGFSSCFRREAGSHGKDTRGIFRVHWFDKVEMFSFCPVDEALDEHARLLGFEEEFLQLLEIPYRVIDVATGDLGSSAARKFDCEAWVPSQERYREVTSTSNCTTFQARRLKIRSRGENGVEPIATLNGTLCAVTRTIVALFENHQEADGSVRIPKALQPYLGGASHFKVK